MEDILEEVIGEIRSEGEETGFVMAKLGEGRWRVNGTMPIEDFRREYPALETAQDVETMGGLMCAIKELIPSQGESLLYQGLRMTVLAGDERRIREILVEAQKRRGA
jgi:CBS domain containing-hemolysin-like protein